MPFSPPVRPGQPPLSLTHLGAGVTQTGLRPPIPSHLTQGLATPLIAGRNNGRFVYGRLSRTWTELGLRPAL